jgi:two-component system, chemotaxis family, sensor kinase CheA
LSIAEKETNNNFIEEFLDDYYAESEEHLMVLRRNLLELERFVNRLPISRALLDELFRSFHSLKGISGMVGLREAERLSHHMESCLRILRDNHIMLTPDGIDALIGGTKMLEQVISARRNEAPIPDIGPQTSQLEETILKHSPSDSASPSSPAQPASQVKAEAEGNHLPAETFSEDTTLWRFTFTPLPALAERGININLVRKRLQELGELRNSVPQVLPGGGIAFEFLVASRADESTFASLQDCGLTYELAEAPEPVAPLTTETETLNSPEFSEPQVLATSQVVRVNLGRLDDLMRMVGDLVISRSRFEDNLKNSESDIPAAHWRSLHETNILMERQLRDLREGIMRVRMVPVGEIFERMRFVVRDLSREYQKKIALELNGGDTEIDKLLIERIADPLMHLVRNSISHGLETIDERTALGKPETGMIRLRAFTSAEMVVLEVEDDGRGIDRQTIAERARTLDLPVPDGNFDNRVLLDLICSPGFSTRKEADRASGRGVGMAVVQNTVLALGGTFTLDTEVGRGTRFTIQLPITLSIADALLVSVGDQKFVVPQSAVREVLEVEPQSLKRFENNEVIHYRDGVLPILRLAQLFGLGENYQRAFHVFVIGAGLHAAGIAVDRILGLREIVVRTIHDPLLQVSGIAGATELGDGHVVLILDAAALIKQSISKGSQG